MMDEDDSTNIWLCLLCTTRNTMMIRFPEDEEKQEHTSEDPSELCLITSLGATKGVSSRRRACNSANGINQIDSIFRNHVLHCLFHICGARSSGMLTALVTATVPENIHSLVSQ